jgi:hypothetical protein
MMEEAFASFSSHLMYFGFSVVEEVVPVVPESDDAEIL